MDDTVQLAPCVNYTVPISKNLAIQPVGEATRTIDGSFADINLPSRMKFQGRDIYRLRVHAGGFVDVDSTGVAISPFNRTDSFSSSPVIAQDVCDPRTPNEASWRDITGTPALGAISDQVASAFPWLASSWPTAPYRMSDFSSSYISVVMQVTGSNNENDVIYGSDTYRADSCIARAVVHQGLLLPGQTGMIRFTRQMSVFAAVERNGIFSRSAPASIGFSMVNTNFENLPKISLTTGIAVTWYEMCDGIVGPSCPVNNTFQLVIVRANIN